jgi:outer membrane murein-binding lipoprotein Lpp
MSAAEWSCGHVAGSMCAECYRELAAKAHELAEDNDSLRDQLAETKADLNEAWARIDKLLGRTP